MASSVTFPNQADVLHETIRKSPVVGTVHVDASAAEIFAGSSALSGRTCMFIQNESTDTRIRIGNNTVKYNKGFPIEPGAVMRLDFDASTPITVYAVSEGASVEVNIMEY